MRTESALEDSDPDAAFFLERAAGFLSAPVVQRGNGTGTEPVLHTIACGLELSLKAVLLAAGWNDERTRLELRHSLTKALTACEGAGFKAVPGLHDVVTSLSRPYETHTLMTLALHVPPPVLHTFVCIAAVHLRSVRLWVGDAEKPPRIAPRRL